MDHSNHVRLRQTEYSPAVLEGATIYDKGGVHAVTNWTKDQLKDMPEHKDMH
jgi:hypothetical protein